MTIEQIRQALADRNIRQVAASTGLSYPTVLSIKNGKHQNPGYQTLQRLEKYLAAPVN